MSFKAMHDFKVLLQPAHLISPSQVEPLLCTWNTFSPKRATGLLGGGPLGL
jgi:hypothetical protein